MLRSLQEQRRKRPLVSPSEVLNLPDLTGYLRLGRGFPLVAEPFIEEPADFRESDLGSEPLTTEAHVDDKSINSPFLGGL